MAKASNRQSDLRVVREGTPAYLIAAFRVGLEEPVARLAKEADEIIYLSVPPAFFAVGQFYGRFDQIEDEEVLAILKEKSKRERAKKEDNPFSREG
ncbi:MAG: hypothetical protein HY730_09760 [Candidatus Tectomicrobia bacterium]|uniref:Phosphoribosyltransferase n=1 Tax=Tectimicrobiota bacterium TaxID=2528274 RepID=A0A933LRQ9_UNCTE|nr:hypothetical protein [Candidatus Tectomicrobia bacterium]